MFLAFKGQVTLVTPISCCVLFITLKNRLQQSIFSHESIWQMSQVSVTRALINGIKVSGDQQPGSGLSGLSQSLGDPLGLGAFSTSTEQEEGEEDDSGDRQQQCQRFQSSGMMLAFS